MHRPPVRGCRAGSPAQVGIAAGGGVDFVPSEQLAVAVRESGLDDPTVEAIVDDYERAQLLALKSGLFAAALLALVSLAFTGGLPPEPPGARRDHEGKAVTA